MSTGKHRLGPIMKRFHTIAGLALIACLVATAPGRAQQVSRRQAVVAYIYNFAKNVEWEHEDALKEFRFHVIGDDRELVQEMTALARAKTLRGRRIRVTSSSGSGQEEGAQLVVLGREKENLLAEVFVRIEGRNTLLVSDGCRDSRLIMLNFVDRDDGTLRFEINKANIINQRIMILPDMILLGGTEVEVAALYREGLQRLRSLQEHATGLEADLGKLEGVIGEKTRALQVQKDSILRLSDRIQEQQRVLSSQAGDIVTHERELRDNIRRLEDQKRVFDAQSRDLEIQKAELVKGRTALHDLTASIDSQKAEIRQQERILEDQDATILRQKNVMALLVIIIVLAVLLFAAVFHGYRNTRKLSTALEAKVSERTIALQNANDRLSVELTERTRAEEELEKYRRQLEEMVRERTTELHEALAQLGAIFEAVNVGIVFLRDRIILRGNAALEEIFGYAPGEMTGLSTRAWYASDAEYALGGAPVTDSIHRGETHIREQRLVRKDGGMFWARMAARALDTSDPSKGMVGVVEDVTTEREHETSLRDALEAAEAADRLKSAFLATMSHELRTPLNSIIGFTGILMKGLTGPLNDEQMKQLGMAKGSAQHLLALINDVLDISKIEAGQLVVSPADFAFAPMLERVVAGVRPLAEKKGLPIDLVVAEDVRDIHSDERRVGQVFINLINNAVKFTETGCISVECVKQGDRVITTVTDTGIGIDPEDMDKLFKPFSQIDTGITRNHEGTGLGLSICHRLLEKLGGTIGVESRAGVGSTFRVSLPTRDHPEPPLDS